MRDRLEELKEKIGNFSLIDLWGILFLILEELTYLREGTGLNKDFRVTVKSGTSTENGKT